MSLAFCCEVCNDAQPDWNITRHGDAVTSWSCDQHLATVCDRLQRDFEVTRLAVISAPKAHEWADLHKALEAIAEGK